MATATPSLPAIWRASARVASSSSPGGTTRLMRPIARACSAPTRSPLEMVMSGALVSLENARAIGLINRVVPPGELDDATRALARQIAGKLGVAVAIGKEAFYRQAELGLDAAYAYTAEVMTRNMLARDTEEGIDAFIEKRRPKWDND